jgi:nicotinamidase-related amidase
MEQNTNTALLILDMQTGILGMLPDAAELIGNVAKAITNARNNKIPVIYVTVGFRQGAPEVSMNNKSFSAGKERFAATNMDEFMKVHPDLAPAADEVTVIKRRVSAFTGSDLEVVLRSFSIQHLVLTGIATSGAVLSTVREAADKDYRITVLADGCADGDEEVHRVLTTKIFLRQADVLTIDEWSKIYLPAT